MGEHFTCECGKLINVEDLKITHDDVKLCPKCYKEAKAAAEEVSRYDFAEEIIKACGAEDTNELRSKIVNIVAGSVCAKCSELKRTPTFGSKPYHFLEGKLYDRHGKEVDPGECVIFKVTDVAFRDALDNYLLLSEIHGVSAEQYNSVFNLITAVREWQAENPNRVKAAD